MVGFTMSGSLGARAQGETMKKCLENLEEGIGMLLLQARENAASNLPAGALIEELA
jgi:predicted RNase H-like HicB family nuclease